MNNKVNLTNKSLLKGINFSIYTSIILTFIGTIIYCFKQNSFQDLLLIFMFMSVITSAITLFVSALFGTFVVLLLEEFNCENYMITSFFGGLLGYLIGLLIFSDWIFMVLIFCFYGASCGFGFSYGYNKGVNK